MTEESVPIGETAILNELAQLKSRADILIAEIEGQAKAAASNNHDIEEGRAYASAVKAELETGVATARAQLLALGQQLEESTASRTELTELETSLKGTATVVQDIVAQATSTLETAVGAATGCTEAQTRASALCSEIEARAEEAATRSAHIEDGRAHAEVVRGQLDECLTQAQQSAASAVAELQSGEGTVKAINLIQANIQESKTSIDSVGEAITLLRSQCEAHAVATKRLAETADEIEAKVKASETRRDELQQSAADLLKNIESLLAGATSAGLAHAFDARSKTFKFPEKSWQSVFIGSIVALLALAIWGTISVGKLSATPNHDKLARMLLHRLPYILPLVWLAIHASRQASLAKRMEEEYAFKATISTSFEGYRRQMADISKDLSETSPLAQLCNDTLRTIGTPPGLVYDRHRMDPTPGTAAAEFIRPVADSLSTAIASKLAIEKKAGTP